MNSPASDTLLPQKGSRSILMSYWMILSTLCFTVMGYCVQYLSIHYSIFALASWRYLVICVGSLVWLLCTGQSIRTTYVRIHFGRSVFGVLSILGYFLSLHHLPVSTATALFHTSPFWILVFLNLSKEIPIHGLWWLIIAVAFLGIVLVVQPLFKEQEASIFIAVGAALCSAISFFRIFQLGCLGEIAPRITFFLGVLGTPLSAVLCALFSPHWENIVPHTMQDGLILLLMTLLSFIGQLSLAFAFCRGHPLLSSAFINLDVLFTFIIDMIYVPEIRHSAELIGFTLIIVCLFLARWVISVSQNAQ